MFSRKSLYLALATSTLAGTVSAQGVESDDEIFALEEIIVTARLREESLQETPLSITAISGDSLEERNITSVRSLMDQTPGVYFTNQGGPGLGNVSMRGLTQGSLIGDEANVASFVDGFYWAGRIAFDGFLDGLERVEVVRGPQSALYGRNSFSGAINYITKKPDMDEMHGSAKVSYGEEGRQSYSGSFTSPLVDGKAAIRIDASHMETGSTWKNSTTGERMNDAESDNLRVQIAWNPSERISMNYAYTYVDRETSEQPLFAIPDSELDSGYKFDFISYSYRNHKSQYPTPRPDSDLDFHTSDLTGSSYGVDRHTFHFDYEADTFLTSILIASTEENVRTITDSSYGAGGNIMLATIGDFFDPYSAPVPTPIDLDGNFIPDLFPTIGGQPIQDREDMSAEIRFQSTGTGPLTWAFGGFMSTLEYTDKLETGYDISAETLAAVQSWVPDRSRNFNAGLFPATYDCNPMSSDVSACPFGFPMVIDNWVVDDNGIQLLQEKFFKNEEYSIFASVGYDLSESTRVQFEARQTWEDRYMEDRVEVTFMYHNPFPEPISEDYTTFTPRVIVDHKLNDNTFLYGVVAKGSKAGGVQPSQSAGSTLYEPEDNWTYEMGAKFTLLDGHLNLNTSVFFVDWSEMQLRENTGLDTVVTNLGSAEVLGFEVMGAWKVHQNVQFRFGYTYQDGEITEGATASAAGYCDLPELEHERIAVSFGDPVVWSPEAQAACDYQPDFTFQTGGSISVTSGDISGNRMANAPKENVVFGLDVNTQFANGLEAFAMLDYNYRSQTYLDFENWTSIDATTNLNAQVGIAGDNWRLTLWGENMTDEDTVVAAIRNFNILGQAGAGVQHRNGPMYGMSLSAQF
jgi:iron complex outermembrane receptor protein